MLDGFPAAAESGDKLRLDVARADSRARDLARAQYPVVLRNAACVADTFERLDSLESRLEGLSKSAPALLTTLDTFLSAGRATVARCKAIQQTFRQLPRVAELLELPELEATCVKSGAHEEALQVDAFARRLALTSASKPLKDIVAEADKLRGLLQRTLEDSLRGAAQLPTIVRSVGLLARLGAYSPRELRMAFLLCRDAHLSEAAAGCLTEPVAARRLARLADIVRTCVFDVATQFRALFPDEDEHCSDDGNAGLLHSWATVRSEWFLALLERDLASVREGNSIASLLDQCMYLGLSLGRIGLDIRDSVATVFARRVTALFETSIADAVEQLRNALSSHKFIRTRLPIVTPPPPPTTSATVSTITAIRVSPSMALLDHPPLAVLVNAYTAALNELRQCAPLCLRKQLTGSLDRSLRAAIAILLAHAEAADPADHVSVEAFCEAACDEAIPYITRCFDLVWNASIPLLSAPELTASLEQHCNRPPPPPTQLSAAATAETTTPLNEPPDNADSCVTQPDQPCPALAPSSNVFFVQPQLPDDDVDAIDDVADVSSVADSPSAIVTPLLQSP